MPTERTARRFIAAAGGDLVLPQATERRLCRGKWPPLAAKELSLLVGSCCFVRCFEVCRTSKLSEKGFNCCGAKLRLRRAESRFEKPRSFLRKGRFSCFSLVRKEPKVHQRFANLWTPGTIQSSAGSDFAEIVGGTCRNRFCPQNAGVKALNRCKRVTAVQTQD